MASKGQARGSKLLALAIGLLPQAQLAPAANAQTPASQAPATQGPANEIPASRPVIRVAPVILAEPEVETSVNIQVGPDGAIPRQTFLRIRGLPLAARLSEGHVVSPGVWAVPLAALAALRLLAPLSSSGRTEIQLSLVGMDGGVLAETKSSLVVAPAWLLGSSGQRQDVTRAVPQTRPDITAAAPSPAVAAPVAEARTIPAVVEQPRAVAAPPPPVTAQVAPPAPVAPVAPVAPPPQPALRPETQAPVVAALPPAAPLPEARAVPVAPPAAVAPPPKAAPQLTAADRERAESMVQRGDAFWRQGNFAAARQFFRRAADMGLAAGALRMGATFDPVELASLAVVGLTADPKEASIWYERARELGAPEASARLSRLQPR